MWGITFYVPAAFDDENGRATAIRHSGIRVGEIIGYRAWRVVSPGLFRRSGDRLRSVYVTDYVWEPNKPASGDVRTHGIYSFRDLVRSREEYGYPVASGPLLFGRVKIWGEVVEHEDGYRSQFARIISLDYGDPELLEKFRVIYGVRAARSSMKMIAEWLSRPPTGSSVPLTWFLLPDLEAMNLTPHHA